MKLKPKCLNFIMSNDAMNRRVSKNNTATISCRLSWKNACWHQSSSCFHLAVSTFAMSSKALITCTTFRTAINKKAKIFPLASNQLHKINSFYQRMIECCCASLALLSVSTDGRERSVPLKMTATANWKWWTFKSWNRGSASGWATHFNF